MKPTILKLVSKSNPPLTDIETMRKRERQYIEDSVVTSGYAADRETVIKLLNEALATEIACLLRYKRHYFKAATAKAAPAAPEFREDVNESTVHANHIAARVIQVRGDRISPIELAARSHAEYVENVTREAMNKLRAMIKEDLAAERLSIESNRETVSYRVEQDPTSRLLDEMLASDEERDEVVSARREGPMG